jgi:hypothetical protein
VDEKKRGDDLPDAQELATDAIAELDGAGGGAESGTGAA